MQEYQNYLNEVINNTYDEIKPFIEIIRNNAKCPNCGGHYIDFTCRYCFQENRELFNSVSIIETILERFEDKIGNLPLNKMPRNKLFNLLQSVSNLSIRVINDFLDNYDYGNNILNDFYEIIQKLDRGEEVSQEEISVIETMIFLNSSTITFDPLYEYFIRQAILGKRNVSYECFCEIIKRFVEKEIKTYYNVGHCVIKPDEELNKKEQDRITLGSSLYNIIWISEEEVRELYYKGRVSILRTIPHELAHCAQFKYIFYGKEISSYGVDELKEHILQKNVSGYYHENYDYITYELEAEKAAIITQIAFLEKLGFVVDKERCMEEIKGLEEKMQVKRRTLNGEETSVDIEFEKYISKHPELLKKHSQLTYLYKVEDNVVIPKSVEELSEDLQFILNNPDNNEETKESAKRFYGVYINLPENRSV